jgi:hypothetical protein
MTLPPVPKGFSAEWSRVWTTFTTKHAFADFELVTFRKALEWFDRADALCADADRAEGRESAVLLKHAMDASCCGLRFWRQLKFTDGEAARRPGRPSGPDWNAQRKAQSLRNVG